MGVKNLWDILESCKKKLPLHHLQNKKVCVDLSCWLVQLQTAHRSPAFAKEKVYLKNLFHRIRALLALNCSLIFVTDGAIPSVKLSTYRRRLGSSSEAAREEVNLQPIPSLPRNMGSGFSCMIKEAKHLGMALGIPCLDGVEEAEAQCALLNSASLCDGCFTSDSDIFLFGARTVYRDVFIGEGGYVICYEMADIEKKLGFGRNSLISLALLLGSDYSNGVYGFGPETACRLVKSVGDDCILDQILSGGVKATRRCKGKDTSNNMSKVGDVCLKSTCEPGMSQDSSGQFLEVINAYLKPKCHLPDSEHAQRVCSIQPFLRSQLQQICEQYFGWSSEKTDQYILPKIAERELRRFSNLRSASSALEIKPLLNEIPVPCPVAAIVKQRKVQGSEYYEVSWRNIDGLQVSVVPGDLVRSACPEKITEFLENKGEGKKQKRIARPKKSTQAALKDVDLQLQELLLGIESESSTLSSTINCPQEVHVYNGAPGKDIVDLSSPSPPSRACKLAKSQKFTDSTTAVTNGISQSLLPSMELQSSNLSGDIQHPTPDNHPIDLSSPLPPIAHKPWNTRGLLVDVKAERSALLDVSKFPQKESILSGAPFECKADANGDDWHLQAPSHSSGTESSHQSGTPESSWRSNTGNLVAETDTVDLSSPSPLVDECKLVKCDKMSNQNVDVIDLSDDSPEHERKARELRLFLDSIRDDLY